jgi:hypothetical protein
MGIGAGCGVNPKPNAVNLGSFFIAQKHAEKRVILKFGSLHGGAVSVHPVVSL